MLRQNWDKRGQKLTMLLRFFGLNINSHQVFREIRVDLVWISVDKTQATKNNQKTNQTNSTYFGWLNTIPL